MDLCNPGVKTRNDWLLKRLLPVLRDFIDRPAKCTRNCKRTCKIVVFCVTDRALPDALLAIKLLERRFFEID
jgi:hypothetical protein